MANGDMIEIPSCEDWDAFWRESREYFNPIFVEKLQQNSIFFNRVETQSWPMNTLPEQRGFRFGRGGYNTCAPWQKVISERCETNSCSSAPEIIAHPGTESYTWSLFKRDMKTEMYCITDWMHRLFPAEELEHIARNNAFITKNVHEEFSRANYIGGAANRWVGVVADPNSATPYCGELDNKGFVLQDFAGENEGTYNPCYVYVKLPASELANISQLSMDQLDEALTLLQREDDVYRLDISQQVGRPVLDVIIPDQKIGRRLWEQTKASGGWWNANTDFSDNMEKYALGIDRVIGNYAFSYDINALRFNVDVAYNSTLGAFNAADQSTWPRLVRVLPYIPVVGELGCRWIVNQAYNYADFGITIVWIPDAMIKWVPPSFTGYGDAQAQVQNYAGDWNWKNPDWECNYKRDQGFFWAQFRMGMQIRDPEIMHTFLHRMPNGKILNGSCCELNLGYTPPDNLDCFTCTGVES